MGFFSWFIVILVFLSVVVIKFVEIEGESGKNMRYSVNYDDCIMIDFFVEWIRR